MHRRIGVLGIDMDISYWTIVTKLLVYLAPVVPTQQLVGVANMALFYVGVLTPSYLLP